MKKTLTGLSLAVLLSLSACGGGETSEQPPAKENEKIETSQKSASESNKEAQHTDQHAEMNHSVSGKVPHGLKTAENPAFEVGSKAVIKAHHIEEMEGAEATIAGAYDTTAYVITYTPTTGGEPIANHKWLTESELSAQ